jgi:hypothetical protein
MAYVALQLRRDGERGLKNNAVESAPRASGEMGTNRLQECGAIG